MDSPSIGHNQDDTQKQARFFYNLGKVIRAKEVLEEAFAAAKTEGFTKSELNFAIKLRADEGGKMLEKFRNTTKIARWMFHPLGFQSTLFEEHPDRRTLKEEAHDEGFADGCMGKTLVIPGRWEPGSEEGQSYATGWHDGQRALMETSSLTKEGVEVIKAEEAEKRTKREKDKGLN